jgi:DNA mismatch repair protein MutS
MGARLLRGWIIRPSINTAEIEARYDAVGELFESVVRSEAIHSSFEGIFDLERLLSRITIGTAGPRELASLRSSISRLPVVGKALAELKAPRFIALHSRLDLLEDLACDPDARNCGESSACSRRRRSDSRRLR